MLYDFGRDFFYEVVGLSMAILAGGLLRAWYVSIMGQPPLGQALTKASHGVGMIVVYVFFVWLVYRWQGVIGLGANLIAHPEKPLNWLPVVVLVWGLRWLRLNAKIAAQLVSIERETLASNAWIKIAVGIAAWVYAARIDGQPGPVWWAYINLALYFLGPWCVSTGITRALLVMRLNSGNARREIENEIARRNAPLRAARSRRY
jgi:hypothetical protein